MLLLMDKRKTIYKLRNFRLCIILSFINLLFGAFLLGVLNAFPKLVSQKIEENLLGGINIDPNTINFNNLVSDSIYLFQNVALQAMILSLIALTAILFLIRFNGGIINRRIIAGAITLGFTIINFASIMIALRFMTTGSHMLANQGYSVGLIIGFIFFLSGLTFLFFKTLRDLL